MILKRRLLASKDEGLPVCVLRMCEISRKGGPQEYNRALQSARRTDHVVFGAQACAPLSLEPKVLRSSSASSRSDALLCADADKRYRKPRGAITHTRPKMSFRCRPAAINPCFGPVRFGQRSYSTTSQPQRPRRVHRTRFSRGFFASCHPARNLACFAPMRLRWKLGRAEAVTLQPLPPAVYMVPNPQVKLSNRTSEQTELAVLCS